MNDYILEMKEIEKSFAVPVLKKVSFQLKQGEVHALVGGNGAGKSTLMKIMTGVYQKDAGEVFINGQKTSIRNVHDAKKHGIAMIFQEMSLVPTMTVAENIYLGQELKKGKLRDKKNMVKKTRELLKSLDIEVDPETKISDLSVGLSQMIEIAKAISKEASILVLDEPTASLSDNETEKLFQMIHKLKQSGVSMVYISHRMNEILHICDSITILRDGQVMLDSPMEGITIDKIIEHMIGGGSANNKFTWKERVYQKDSPDLLSVKHLSINELISDISFSLKPGEILGFAGLMGSGRTEILEALFGLRKKQGGSISLEGQEIQYSNAKGAMKQGFALIPEDRRRQGLVLDHSLKENAILPILNKTLKYKFFVDEKKANQIVESSVKDLSIVTEGIFKKIALLSGGNQQKVVIAKWLNTHPRIMMLDEPTAGVDIGAKGEIIELIRAFANQGKGVLFVSSELAELMAVCDRILILYSGKITGELYRSEIESEEELQYAIQRKE